MITKLMQAKASADVAQPSPRNHIIVGPTSRFSLLQNNRNTDDNNNINHTKIKQNYGCKSLKYMATIATSSASAAAAVAKFPLPFPSPRNPPQFLSLPRRARSSAAVCASLSAAPVLSKPDDLVKNILSKVVQTDRGVLLAKNEHQEVAQVADELQNFCVNEPVKCPLIFGEWDVVYCSNPTSPGGGYRSALGRLVFKTKEMVQVVEAPDVVRNRVSFSLLGFIDGEVSLKGKLTALDDKWIQVVFEAPELKVGGAEFTYGGESEVKLQITYVDDKIRLGKGSRGSLFVFKRL